LAGGVSHRRSLPPATGVGGRGFQRSLRGSGATRRSVRLVRRYAKRRHRLVHTGVCPSYRGRQMDLRLVTYHNDAERARHALRPSDELHVWDNTIENLGSRQVLMRPRPSGGSPSSCSLIRTGILPPTASSNSNGYSRIRTLWLRRHPKDLDGIEKPTQTEAWNGCQVHA
jgi:hypothetical protein